MAITFVGTLQEIPETNRVVFLCNGGSNNSVSYAKFFIDQWTKTPEKWEKGALYIVKCSTSYAKYNVGTKEAPEYKDDLRCELRAKVITPYNYPNYDVINNGFGKIKGIVTGIKQITREYEVDDNPHIKDITVISRIKLSLGDKYWTYLWKYDSDDSLNFTRGDTISCVVTIFNKRAYQEEDFSISKEERHLYKGDPKWYTELQLIDAEVINE